MVQHEFNILAIQEHTLWNRELSQVEIASIEKTCDERGFSIIFSKLQLLIIGPQGTSMSRRCPHVCRIHYKSGQFFSLFL
jgi:hypothetical protein